MDIVKNCSRIFSFGFSKPLLLSVVTSGTLLVVDILNAKVIHAGKKKVTMT